MAAFPELSLYIVSDGEGNTCSTSSGRDADDEFQRTMGCLFAVFWLMRHGLDGAQSFVFGVGRDWQALDDRSEHPQRAEEEINKRKAFRDQVDWAPFVETLRDAQLLNEDGSHNEERVLAMLVLSAIHDIMKTESLLPKVVGEWPNHKDGDVINDHDVALAYVMERHPAALPSYAGLCAKQQQTLKFSQGSIAYNMGWLVQAEAPPGALFGKFKEVIDAGEAHPEDIAFYFVHWLTDLAGAQPCPQEGCEKFVLMFPLKVLITFAKSFPVVQHLSSQSETAVLAEYLQWRWQEHEPSLGIVPSGPGSVARMRLVVMAQGNSEKVLEAYDNLSVDDREVLNQELALTGCTGQSYQCDPLEVSGGPALLVYYAPALMQKNCATDPDGALRVLAEVLKQGRHLWPLNDEAAGETVTLQIAALKGLDIQAIKALQAGECWTLCRNSSVNALAQKINLLAEGQQQVLEACTRILSFWSCSVNRSGLQSGWIPASC